MFQIARTRLYAVLPALILCGASVQAAQTPYVAMVVPATAEVRCKPGTDPKLYPTNRLAQGMRVLVLEERTDGWLGIQPPPGSFSWVNLTLVERISPNQANWVVKSDNTPVLIGGDVVQTRPTVEGVRLVRGTQVHVIGQEVRDLDGSTWLPIDPPAGEMRYLHADTVRAAGSQPGPAPAVQQPVRVASVPTQPTPGNPFTLTKSTSSKDPPLSIPAQASNVPPPAANATPWQKAEYYERLGQWNEAIRIYEQLGKDLQVTRPEWADFARKRASYLSTGGRAPINWSAQSPAATSTFYPASQQQPPPVVRLAPPSDPNAPQTAPQGLARSGPGRLVRSGYYRMGYAQYRLETQDPNPTYATPGQGVDLEQFVDKGSVELFGTRQYDGNLKSYCMVVSRVQPQ